MKIKKKLQTQKVVKHGGEGEKRSDRVLCLAEDHWEIVRSAIRGDSAFLIILQVLRSNLLAQEIAAVRLLGMGRLNKPYGHKYT